MTFLWFQKVLLIYSIVQFAAFYFEILVIIFIWTKKFFSFIQIQIIFKKFHIFESKQLNTSIKNPFKANLKVKNQWSNSVGFNWKNWNQFIRKKQETLVIVGLITDEYWGSNCSTCWVRRFVSDRLSDMGVYYSGAHIYIYIYYILKIYNF